MYERREELQKLFRLTDGIVPSKQGFAELLLDATRRKKVLEGRKKPLRALADLAHVSPQLLEVLLTTERKADYYTAERLAELRTATVGEWWESLGYETGIADRKGERDRTLSRADQAVLDLIGHWPDERKYALVTALQQVLEAGRADNSHE